MQQQNENYEEIEEDEENYDISDYSSNYDFEQDDQGIFKKNLLSMICRNINTKEISLIIILSKKNLQKI